MSLVQNLIKEYSDFKINIPEWQIADHGITALWGPSGAGKTTCFRILLGLESCPGLNWKFHDTDLAQLSVPERRLGVVFQTLELFPHMSAKENILFAGQARKIKGLENKTQQLLERLKLEECAQRQARVLSGGEKQRVALARALVGEPRFLFLDESFSSLDSDLRTEARKLVKEVIGEAQIPTLLITHDKEDIDVLANTVVRIDKGHLVEM